MLGGAFCEVILAISVIGTAVTLFPVIKRQNEAVALGYVAGRVVEAVVIVVGIISLSLAVWLIAKGFTPARDATAGHPAAEPDAAPGTPLRTASGPGQGAALAAG